MDWHNVNILLMIFLYIILTDANIIKKSCEIPPTCNANQIAACGAIQGKNLMVGFSLIT
jgi:hypothetical protein